MASSNKNSNQSSDDLKQQQKLFGDLLKTIKEVVDVRDTELSVTRDINDAIREQLASVKNNLDFKTSTRRILGEINKLAEQNVDFTKEERKILLDKESILKRQSKLFNTRNQLERESRQIKSQISILKEKTNLSGEELDINTEQIKAFEMLEESLSEQLINSEIFSENLSQALNSTQKLNELAPPKIFSGLSDIATAIPGLRKFAGPFQDAAKASKEIAAEQISTNLATKQRVSHFQELYKSSGKLRSSMEEAGVSAKEIRNGFTFDPSKIGLNSLKSGFKSLGPIIAKSLGPVSLIIMAAQAIKSLVDEMFAASEQTANFSNNLLLSRESARELRQETYNITNLYNQLASEQGSLTITQEKYLKTLNSINDQLGLQLDLTRGFGEQTAKNVAQASILTDQYGLSAEASTQLFLDAERLNKPLKDYTEEIFGQLAYQSTQKGLMVDITKTIEKASNISGELRANFKGNTLELAQAVYQSKLLGLSLEQSQRISEGLLNFQGSIEAEMQAELLTGRQLNLEKAREYALNNNNLGVLREITNQGITQEEFSKSNYLQRKAIAGAIGLSTDELSDMFQKQKELSVLEEKSLRLRNRLKAEGKSLDDKTFDAEKANLFEIAAAAEKAGKSEEEIRKILAKQVEERKNEQSATQKFNKSLDQLKEKFSELVDGGLLDSLIDILTGIAESSMFKGFKEQGEAKRLYAALKKEKQAGGNVSDEDLKNAELGTKKDGFVTKKLIEVLLPGVGSLINEFSDKRINNAREKTQEKSKELGLLNTPEELDDFILRPGKPPLKFNKDDLLIGGTNLINKSETIKDDSLSVSKLNEINNNLNKLLQVIEKGGNVYLDSVKVGETITKTLSRIS